MNKQISKAEVRWVAFFSLFVILLTGAPYVFGLINAPHNFSGFFIGVEDGNSYLAKMLLGAQGDWLFRSPYSVQQQSGALLYTPYLLFGKFLGSEASHLGYVLVFHLFRTTSIVALCFACYAFFSLVVEKIGLRRLGLAVATLGGGLGWLLLLIGRSDWWGSLPLDFYSPEAFGYLAVFGLPHLVLARALLLFGLASYLRSKPPLMRPWSISLLWLAMSLTHLINAALGLFLIGLHLAIFYLQHRQQSKVSVSIRTYLQYAIWAGVGAAPVFLFNVWALWRDSYLRSWAAQNQILSPNPFHFIFAYGWLLPFAYFGLKALRKNAVLSSFFSVWLFSLPVLFYLPFGLQRRLSECAWILILALALRFFDGPSWAKAKSQLWLFTLAVPSTLILYLGVWQTVINPRPPVVLPSSEIAAFEALKDVSEPGEVVLSAYETGNALPAWVPVRVVIGHGPETAHLKTLMNQVENFYEPSTPENLRTNFLRNNHIDLVVRGPAELLLGRWDPADVSYLEPVYTSEDYEIFRVVLP